ncbi:hypothetical protein HWV62_26829 [Athelia sp. TMB]|nr:hypothetical protein HWV62_26829 [Athelia sp. TMB]
MAALATQSLAKLYVHNSSFTPDEILRVTAENVTQGCESRYSVLVNGSFPGPELRFQEGDQRWIRVYNDMSDKNLTMHWHGLSMATYPFSDGTPQASQWPIPPKHYFDYQLHLEQGQAGTYYYHSHVDFQAVSCSGPLIIEEKSQPPYKYDEERLIYLSDYFNETDTTIFEGLVGNPFVWSGETNAVLINGQGISNTVTGDAASSCPLASIPVQPGKTYRLRFIGATALSFVSLAFEGHNVSVIEADGQYTKPEETSYMQVGPGQRYSALLHTKTCEELKNQTQFWLQAETRERPTLYRGYAALSYSDECSGHATSSGNATGAQIPSNPPIALPNATYGFLDYQLQPLTPNDFPTASEVTRRVTVTVQQIVNGTITWGENGIPWTEYFPRKPYLVDMYEHDGADLPNYAVAVANGGMDNRTRAFPAKLGEVLEIVLQNSAAPGGGMDVHPFHAHGAHVYDIGSGNGTYDAQANEKRLQGTQPVKRDTTMLYRYEESTTPGADSGWRAWRLRIDEAGVWMIHCHTLQHMIMGMQTVWVFGNTTDILKLPKLDVQGYLTYGGDAYGNDTRDAKVMHWDEEI